TPGSTPSTQPSNTCSVWERGATRANTRRKPARAETKKAGPSGPAFPIRGEVVFRLPGRFVDRHGAPFPPIGSIDGRTRTGASVLRLKSRGDAVSAAGPEDVH